MCDPVSLAAATLAMTAASAAAQVKAQQDAADAQSQSNDRQYKQTMLNAANNNTQVNLKEQQIRAQAIEKMNANNVQEAVATGKSTAIAGVNGVGGNSVGAALGAIAGTSDKYNASVLASYDAGISGAENDRSNVYANAANTINGLKTPLQPDYMGAGLKIANAYGAYSQGSSKPTTNTDAGYEGNGH